jgi:hypothetical protein
MPRTAGPAEEDDAETGLGRHSSSAPFTAEGSLTVDFVALLLIGRQRGFLTPDDLMAVLESVELTPTLIDAVVGRVRSEGIEWRDDHEPPEGPPA